MITSDEIYHQLEAVCANEISVTNSTNYGPTDGLQANSAYGKQANEKEHKKRPKCYNFAKGQPCRKTPCTFSHEAPEQKQAVKANTNPSPAHASPLKCNKCGGKHLTKECRQQLTCNWHQAWPH